MLLGSVTDWAGVLQSTDGIRSPPKNSPRRAVSFTSPSPYEIMYETTEIMMNIITLHQE